MALLTETENIFEFNDQYSDTVPQSQRVQYQLAVTVHRYVM